MLYANGKPLNPVDERILILAPTGRDAKMAREVLTKSEFYAVECANFNGLLSEWNKGASVLLLAEEALLLNGLEVLTTRISQQDPWSDIPIIILTSGGVISETQLKTLNIFAPSGNVTYLERPFRKLTLISTIQMALRARIHQYELRNTLKRLETGEERLRLALDAGKIGVWEWNIPDDKLVGSSKFYSFYGIDPTNFSGSIFDLEPFYHPQDRERLAVSIEAVLQGNPLAEVQFRVMHPKKGLRWLYSRGKVISYTDGKPVRMLGATIDISDRIAAEEEIRKGKEKLLQSQKVEAIGKLAGGIAHDFNNMLTAINGFSALLLEQLDDREALRMGLEEIQKSGTRAASLTKQLLAYSRQQIMAFQVLDLSRLVNNVGNMLQRLIGEDIALKFNLPTDLPGVKADPTQMEQVILNLTLNARDAMPGGGRIWIETGTLSVGKANALLYPDTEPGDYVTLTVRDDGFGMDEQTLSQVFEPFFTTKELGKGTGMGLSTVHGIVIQSGGNILVKSAPNKGSTFTILLPAANRLAEETPVEVKSDEALHLSGKTILVVEDEESVGRFLEYLLKSKGYHVMRAESGKSALRIAREYSGEIHLLLTDVVMPEMGGRMLSEKMAKLRPGIKTLFVSGYTDDVILHHGVLDSEMEFMNKPFSPPVLLEKLRSLLEVKSISK